MGECFLCVGLRWLVLIKASDGIQRGMIQNHRSPLLRGRDRSYWELRVSGYLLRFGNSYVRYFVSVSPRRFQCPIYGLPIRENSREVRARNLDI